MHHPSPLAPLMAALGSVAALVSAVSHETVNLWIGTIGGAMGIAISLLTLARRFRKKP